MFLFKDKRQELINLIREIAKEEIKLGNHWDLWAKEEKHLSHVEKEILHILLQLMHKKKIFFKQDRSDADAQRLFELLEDFRKDIVRLKEGYEQLTQADKEHVDSVNRRLDLILSAIHRDQEEMTGLINKEFGISEGALFSVIDREFCVEFHPKMRAMKEIDGDMMMSTQYEPYLLVFDNGYLVAAIQGEIKEDTFVVQSTHETYLKFKGYIGHAISFLLAEKKIAEWQSGEITDPDVERVYESLKAEGHLHISHAENSFRIRLIERL